MDYFMPRAENAVPTTLIDCGEPSPANPLGAKGAGEGRRDPVPSRRLRTPFSMHSSR